MVAAFLFKYLQLHTKWKSIEHPPELMAYTIWGLWTGLTGLVVCSNTVWLWMNYRILLQMIVMIWTIYGLLRLNMSDRLIYWTLIVGCLIQLIALKLGYSFDKYAGLVVGEEQMGEGRVAGLTGNANSLGFMMVTGVYCTMLLWKMKRSPVNILLKMLLIAFVVVAVYVTWQTGSRKTSAAMVILIIGWVVWLLPQGKGVSSLMFRVSAVIVMLIIGGALLTYVVNETIVGKRFNDLIERGSGSLVLGVEEDVRSDMYRAGWQMFVENPVAGVGFAHFQVHYWAGAYSHSDYIEPLACTGLVGFILYHSFSVLLVRRILRLRKRVRDQEEKYKLNAILITLVTGWLLGLGAPYWSVQRHYIIVTAFATYTWMLDRKMKGIDFEPNRLREREPGRPRFS